MHTDCSPLPGIATGAEVLYVGITPNLQTGAIFCFSLPHQAAQNRRRIMEAHHSAHLHKSSGMLQRLPATGVNQKPFCDLNGGHWMNCLESSNLSIPFR